MMNKPKGNNMKATILAILLGMSVTAFGADKPADKPVVKAADKPAAKPAAEPARAPAVVPEKKGEGLKK
tara:strand:+ start:220 stop:426 length:207 start_codon:yes stop_codon:yes gene_type:complete